MKIGPPYTLRLRVKFYSSEPQTLHEELTRYQFFLQLKQDIQTGRLPCPFDAAVELAAYILQSELGDYDPDVHTTEFISEFRFLPEEEQTEEMETAIVEAYKKLAGQTPAQVELSYLKKVKWLEMYGVDIHIVYGKDGNEYMLGLTPAGILVLEGSAKIGMFFWPKITRLLFNKKKLTLVVWEDDDQGTQQIEHTFVFRLRNKKAAKHLWKCAVEHHTFFRLSGAPQAPSARQNFFRMGSRFRYSGKTEIQATHENRARRTVQFERRPSQRYSRRSSIRRPPIPTSSNPVIITPAVTKPPVAASEPAAGTVGVVSSKMFSPPPPALPPKSATLPAPPRQASMSSSSCEVIAATILHVGDSPPPVPPRSSTLDTKRSPSLTEIALREEKPLLQINRAIDFSGSNLTTPTASLRPARSQTLLTSPSWPDQSKTDTVNLKSEEIKRAPAFNEAPSERTTTLAVVDIPIVNLSTFSTSHDRNPPPREIMGFKLTPDMIKPKDPPKELVSILKSSDTHNLTPSLKPNNGSSRHPSSDSGRASPRSSPSASPSPTSSALSAVTARCIESQSVLVPDTTDCDTVPLLLASCEEEHEEEVAKAPVRSDTETDILLGTENAESVVNSTEDYSEPTLVNLFDEYDIIMCCSDSAALLDNVSEPKEDACEEHSVQMHDPSLNGSNGVSRSGSGASSGSTTLPPNNHRSGWTPSEIKSALPITSTLKSEPSRFRRVITTEL
ncbi:protein 4.1-like isoform X2 [Paramacrobiotus metropolitanus]|nr:protein 4.1-like isoform X2 [Paramacrobiotus metropolitanus]